MDNRTNGGRFEQELAKTLADHGFWCHVMQQNKSGQPADIIAIKGKFHTLIDCKVISDNNGFTFDRVEENQKYAMRSFQRKGNDLCYFALRLPDGDVHMLALEKIENLKGYGKKRLTEAEIREKARSLKDWMELTTEWGRDI